MEWGARRGPATRVPAERKDSRDNVMHDYRDALHKSLLFYRAQRSGDLSGGPNPIPWRTAPSFLSDGADAGRGVCLVRQLANR